MSGAAWKAAARKSLRGTVRTALEPHFACGFASPSAVIARDGARYAIVNLQTSTTSDPGCWELYVNYGTGTDAWFDNRGYGPPKPRSEADCEHRDRHTPDQRLFPDSQFQRLRVPEQEWLSDTGRAQLSHYLETVTKTEILPWITRHWATSA